MARFWFRDILGLAMGDEALLAAMVGAWRRRIPDWRSPSHRLIPPIQPGNTG